MGEVDCPIRIVTVSCHNCCLLRISVKNRGMSLVNMHCMGGPAFKNLENIDRTCIVALIGLHRQARLAAT